MNIKNAPKANIVIAFIVISIIIGLVYHIQMRPLSVTIISFNDLHSQLAPIETKEPQKAGKTGGIAYVSQTINTLRESNPNAILMEAGDLVTGPSWRLFDGKPETKAANLMGVQVGTLGNHEFDHGVTGLESLLTNVNFPIVAANLTLTDETLNDLITDGIVITTKDGIQVGVFGLVIPELFSVTTMVEGVKVNPDTKTVATEMVKKLNAKGAKVIIALTHQGLDSDVNLAENVSGIHAIIGGHSYTPTTEKLVVSGPEGWSTVIVQTKPYGQYLGLLKLSVQNGKLDQKKSQWQLIEVKANGEPDHVIQSLVDEYDEQMQSLVNTPIGQLLTTADATKISNRSEETGLGNFLADAIRWRLGTDIGFMNAGGIRGDRIFEPQSISIKDITQILPFSDNLWRVELTGQEIRETLEISASALTGVKDDYLASTRTPSGGFLQISGLRIIISLESINKPILIDNSGVIVSPGNRVKMVQVWKNGAWAPLNDNERYSVAVLSFTASGGDKHVIIRNAENRKNTQILDNEAIADYITHQLKGKVELKTDGRIQIKRAEQ